MGTFENRQSKDGAKWKNEFWRQKQKVPYLSLYIITSIVGLECPSGTFGQFLLNFFMCLPTYRRYTLFRHNEIYLFQMGFFIDIIWRLVLWNNQSKSEGHCHGAALLIPLLQLWYKNCCSLVWIWRRGVKPTKRLIMKPTMRRSETPCMRKIPSWR